MYNGIRWQQRFANFEKAYNVFQRRINEYQEDFDNEAILHEALDFVSGFKSDKFKYFIVYAKKPDSHRLFINKAEITVS